MNIGIVTTWFERGAAYVSRQYRQVLQHDHNVYIYARADEYAIGDPSWDDEYVTWGKRLPFVMGTAVDLRDFRRWLVEKKIQLIIFNEQKWWPLVKFCNHLGIITGAYVDYYTEETVPFFECYDFLICNTRRHYSVFSWHPNCIYIPWGTDLLAFKPSNFEPVVPGRVTFFHSSGMSPYRKGTDWILKAMDYLPNEARLFVHSQGSLNEKMPQLGSLIDRLIKEDKLEVYEKTVPTPGLYKRGDVYVYPSRLDGIGLSVPEALASGLPVITTNSPPMNEFVIPGENGRVVKIDKLVARADGYYWPQALIDQESLRKEMAYYVTNYESLAQFKAEAREYAENKLDWFQNAKDLASQIETVTKRSESELEDVYYQILQYEKRHTSIQQKYPKLFHWLIKLTKLFRPVRV
ncbi:MAG: glycosyltransferase family 4 protein [Ardenticatenaceae bacterium]|nr:glycosyltransferase family 4 protein [Ardenticatenaceae bacterium]